MRRSKSNAFTLVELLVVIGIIAVLVGVLLPALSKARQSANTLKCSANLRSIGQGIAMYVSENKGTLPASYIYVGHRVSGGVQSPDKPVNGYVHWSSFIFGNKASEAKFATGGGGLGITSNNAGPYASTSGWEVFQCPSLDNGGLPPTDPASGMGDSSMPADVTGYADYQAPRLAYTLNESLCPRNKFTPGFQGVQRTEHFVRAGSVAHSADVILGTEWNQLASVVQATGEVSGAMVCKSHRPVNGFFDIGSVGGNFNELTDVAPGGPNTILRVPLSQMTPDPKPGFSPKSRLDWVGRNHGSYKLDGAGWDLRKTNFLYLDGHVETKHIRETVKPWQWGQTMYSLEPNNDVQSY